MVRLRKLIEKIPDLEVRGSQEVLITGLTSHSQKVAPGNLFVAKKGSGDDGNRYVLEALAAGATATLSDIYDPFLPITQIISPNVSKVEALLAATFFHFPAKELPIIGVTGTAGKTSTTYLARSLLEKGGISTGLVGGVESIVGESRYPSSLTTPDVITNHKLLREMVDGGCKAALFEVTSHALMQGRVGEIDFTIALFTNFSQDHLDYHQTMEAYFAAKNRLFQGLGKESLAILNGDEPICKKIETKARVFTYGIREEADLRATQVLFSPKGSRFQVTYRGKELPCATSLLGTGNVYNILAALSIGLEMGISLEEGIETLGRPPLIPGRLERIKNGLKLSVFVDHAHKPNALRTSLGALEGKERIVVFGCGGDRDREKRPLMGKIASELASQVILTSDNPRSEDPEAIIREILRGIPKETAVEIELDREKAIRRALALTKERDAHLLIAGKGHESEQIFSHHSIPFSDREVASRVLKEMEESCPCAT